LSKAGGAILLLRKNNRRSAMSPTATIDAKIKNQIGQPAASTSANKVILHETKIIWTLNQVVYAAMLGSAGRNCSVSYPVEQPFSEFSSWNAVNPIWQNSIFVYAQILWITLWIEAGISVST
jgi:hypothetical protein